MSGPAEILTFAVRWPGGSFLNLTGTADDLESLALAVLDQVRAHRAAAYEATLKPCPGGRAITRRWGA